MSPRISDGPTCSGRKCQLAGFAALLAASERGVVALDVFDVDHADLADVAVADHGARLADEREAGVVEGLAEDDAGGADAADEVERVVEIGGQRLVADHVEAALDRRDRERVVAVVRRHDGDHLHAVGARALAVEHLAGAAIGAIVGQADGAAGGARALRVGGEDRGDDLVVVVEPGGSAVNRADERARTAADDAEAEAPAEFWDGLVHWDSSERMAE